VSSGSSFYFLLNERTYLFYATWWIFKSRGTFSRNRNSKDTLLLIHYGNLGKPTGHPTGTQQRFIQQYHRRSHMTSHFPKNSTFESDAAQCQISVIVCYTSVYQNVLLSWLLYHSLDCGADYICYVVCGNSCALIAWTVPRRILCPVRLPTAALRRVEIRVKWIATKTYIHAYCASYCVVTCEDRGGLCGQTDK